MAGKVQTAARPERQAGRPAGTQDMKRTADAKKEKEGQTFL